MPKISVRWSDSGPVISVGADLFWSGNYEKNTTTQGGWEAYVLYIIGLYIMKEIVH